MRITLLLLFISLSAHAQQSLDTLTLEKLLNSYVTTGSRNSEKLKETPNIISVVTQEDIQRSNAREITDVLRMLPGIDLGMDIDNAISLSSRGIWGQEGKILIMLDGIQLTENWYAAYQLFQRIPLSIIKRIEVIRGAGSVIYGGNAGLMVIQIITNTPEDLSGGKVNAFSGTSNGKVLNRQGMSAEYGNINCNGVEYALKGWASNAHISNTDVVRNGKFYNGFDRTKISQSGGQIKVKYKDININYLYDSYVQNTFQGYDLLFQNHYLLVQKNLIDKPKMKLVAQSENKFMKNYATINALADSLDYVDQLGFRSTLRLINTYQISENTKWLSGIEGYYDRGYYANPSPYVFTQNNKTYLNLYNIALYQQLETKYKHWRLTGGLRLDVHSEFKPVFLPRLAAIYQKGKLHSKIMFNKAFRAPNIANLSYNPIIQPEIITTFESEIGIRLRQNLQWNTNFSINNINNTIVFNVDSLYNEFYYNNGRVQSFGLESEFRFFPTWGTIIANTSIYAANSKFNQNMFLSPNERNSFLGISNVKNTLSAEVKIRNKTSVSLSAVTLGKRYYLDALKNLTYANPTLFVNAGLKMLQIKNMTLQFIIWNVLNQKAAYLTTINANANFLRGTGREYMLNLTLRIY